jgi:hypothetical protein
MIGVALGGLAMASAGHALEGEPNRKGWPTTWSRLGSGLGAAGMSGVIGFLSLIGILGVALKLFEDPPELAAFSFVALMLAVLVWSVHWRILRLPGGAPSRVIPIATPIVLSILNLGLVWTGSASGGVVPGGGDQLAKSAFDLFFPGSPAGLDLPSLPSVAPMIGAIVLLGVFLGFWTTGRRMDFWTRLHETAPRFSRFLGGGYGVDLAFAKLKTGIMRLGGGAEWLFGAQLWENWVPRALAGGVRTSARFAQTADDRIAEGLASGLRVSTEFPARMLQAIQSGDVRWYLFFAIGSGIAMLLHFSKLW